MTVSQKTVEDGVNSSMMCVCVAFFVDEVHDLVALLLLLLLWCGNGVRKIIKGNASVFSLLAMSKGLRVVTLCCNRILQFLSRGAT